MSSSQLAIVQTYKVQTNGNSTASKAKKPSHGSHSISVYCNNTSANYCNIFAYLRITYNTSGACLNLPEFVLDTQVFIKISNVYRNLNGKMKLDLCICEALSYTHVTTETAFVGMAIITTNIN